ncbi:MAG: hypothetical protein JJU18_09220 [Oceanicaulis sp.]|nr:hypothetical protein [Oceanicaulis sp.]
MARLALIDDDPVEALILRELIAHGAPDHALAHFTSVEAFTTAAQAAQTDLVILDRRVPPHDSFCESLPVIEGSGYRGPVLLISAAPEDIRARSPALALTGPMSKSDLLTPEAVARAVNGALAARA